uniref:Uncharacterized protein n=1 Tax=viral metagenome TaxID=1070528 RepID=A0A6C0HRZ6_9ZZZZ
MPYDQSTFGTLLYGVKGVGFAIRKQGRVRLGGGINGLMAMPTVDKVMDSEFETTRVLVKEVWNNRPVLRNITGAKTYGDYACTPFRKVMNAGDVFTRVNYSCGGNCQTPQSIPGIASIKNSIGAIQSFCDRSLHPPSSCNVRYVYDSSDYTRYLKQNATLKNYNDLSFGGDQNNGSYQALQASKRY